LVNTVGAFITFTSLFIPFFISAVAESSRI
jgi:hypothetical protein